MLSWVLPYRNEYPYVMWSIYSIINDIPKDEPFEVIIVENGSDEVNLKFLDYFFEAKKTGRPAGLARGKFVKVVHNDVIGGAPALARGVDEAKGDIVGWSCSHIAVERGSIPRMIKLVREKKQMVHSPMLWMGDYFDNKKWKLYSYWNPLTRGWHWSRFRDTPYTICSGGGGMSMFTKKQWVEFGGFDKNLNVYGGGEIYLDNKWWLFGGEIWLEPNSLYYHWAYKRNFKWNMNDVRWNQMVAYYTIGGDKLINMMYGDKIKDAVHKPIYDKVKVACVESRKFILDNQKYESVFEMWKAQPWDFPKVDWMRKTGNTVGLAGYEKYGLI